MQCWALRFGLGNVKLLNEAFKCLGSEPSRTIPELLTDARNGSVGSRQLVVDSLMKRRHQLKRELPAFLPEGASRAM